MEAVGGGAGFLSKKIFDSILFDISQCRWLLGASTYILSESINYVRIISSATRHQSYISLASTNNI